MLSMALKRYLVTCNFLQSGDYRSLKERLRTLDAKQVLRQSVGVAQHLHCVRVEGDLPPTHGRPGPHRHHRSRRGGGQPAGAGEYGETVNPHFTRSVADSLSERNPVLTVKLDQEQLLDRLKLAACFITLVRFRSSPHFFSTSTSVCATS